MDKKVASAYQKYKTQYPLLLKMWNDKKAKSSTPYDYDGKINFKCECGHEFTCTIDEFIKRCDARNIYIARFNSFHLPCPICEAKLKSDFLAILDSKEFAKREIPQFKDHEVLMIDVETNGLNSKSDDLLEIAIYKPDDNKFFHKYLPLTKQSDVYTTQFNGITKEMLKNATHITNEEIDILINEFEITKRTLLHYGTLDAPFMKEYFKFIKFPNRTKIEFYNFKKNIYSSQYTNGEITKDSLCKMLGLTNVQKVHDAQNDCLLQWKLFKKMNNKPWLVTNANELQYDYDVFEYNDEYYMPSSFVESYKRLHELTGVHLPTMSLSKIRDIISIELPEEVNKYHPAIVSYFLGGVMEKQITTNLNAIDLSMESFLWCTLNKAKLNKIGSFVAKEKDIIEYSFDKNGKINIFGDKNKREEVRFLTSILQHMQIKAEEDELLYEITTDGFFLLFRDKKEKVFDLSIFPNISIEMQQITNAHGKTNERVVVYGNNRHIVEKITNEFIDIITPYTKECADAIKNSVFRNKPIYAQENTINDKYHTLAICDFSNEHAIMEMKVSFRPLLTRNYASQCFLQSTGTPVVNRFEPLLKDFNDSTLLGQKRRELYLCAYDATERKLTVAEYEFTRDVDSNENDRFLTFLRNFKNNNQEIFE